MRLNSMVQSHTLRRNLGNDTPITAKLSPSVNKEPTAAVGDLHAREDCANCAGIGLGQKVDDRTLEGKVVRKVHAAIVAGRDWAAAYSSILVFLRGRKPARQAIFAGTVSLCLTSPTTGIRLQMELLSPHCSIQQFLRNVINQMHAQYFTPVCKRSRPFFDTSADLVYKQKLHL
jgi:hypothetical protein